MNAKLPQSSRGSPQRFCTGENYANGTWLSFTDVVLRRLRPSERRAPPHFAMLSRGSLELVLSTPFGPGGAAKPMLDGRRAEPGGWNRIIINVHDLPAEVTRLQGERVHFRSGIVSGPGGSEVVLDDPSGNPVELFQPAA